MFGVLSVLVFVLSFTNSKSANILAVFPIPSISHQVVFRPLTHELAKRGHKITVVTTDPAYPDGNTPPNLYEISTQNESYTKWNEVIESMERDYLIVKIEKFIALFTDLFDLQLQIPEVQKAIKEEYDLLIIEACVRITVGLSHVIKAPVIQISSFGGLLIHYHQFGAPIQPFLYPTPGRQKLYNLSLLDKLAEIFKTFTMILIAVLTEKHGYEMMRRNFGDDVPTMNTLEENIDLIFLNESPVWADNRPVPPNIVYIGGIHEVPKQELPGDLKSYLDSSKHGVIYLSFGTNVKLSMLPKEKIEIIIKVFSQLPYDVLWKWYEDELPGKSSNIRVSKWFPQADILRHPKVKVFVTQCGLQSTDEAFSAGVPLIGIPILADQWYNAEKYEKHGIGIQLDIHSLTEEKFKKTIETIIRDDSYRKNILKLNSINRDQPLSPLERAVWWTEYVIRHGGAKHLMAPATKITWTEYYEVKLVSIIFALLLLIVVTLLLLVRYIIKIITKKIGINTKLKKQ